MSSALCLSETPDWLQPWCRLHFYPRRKASLSVLHPTTGLYHSGCQPAHSASSAASLPHSDLKGSTAGQQKGCLLIHSKWTFFTIGSHLQETGPFSELRYSHISSHLISRCDLLQTTQQILNGRHSFVQIVHLKTADRIIRRQWTGRSGLCVTNNNTVCDWFSSYRGALSNVLLGGSSAVPAAIWSLLIHGGTSWIILLVRGVDILLPSHRRADFR